MLNFLLSFYKSLFSGMLHFVLLMFKYTQTFITCMCKITRVSEHFKMFRSMKFNLLSVIHQILTLTFDPLIYSIWN